MDSVLFLIQIIKLKISVFIVPQNRVPNTSQMNPNLVGFSGHKFRLQHCHIPVILKRLIYRLNIRSILIPSIFTYGYTVYLPVFFQMPFYLCTFGYYPLHKQAIKFTQASVFQQSAYLLAALKGFPA